MSEISDIKDELAKTELMLDKAESEVARLRGKYRDALVEVSQCKGWGEELLQSVKELKCDNPKCGVHSSITGETYWCQICTLQHEYGVESRAEEEANKGRE